MATPQRTAPATAPPVTALAIRPALDQLEKVAREVNLQSIAKIENRFEQAVVLADGVTQLRSLLTPPVMAKIGALQNSALGFKTDRDQGYPDDVVKDCFIEATLRGLLPVGNQFNILASRCYVTKEGFTYLQAKHPGLTDLRLDLGVPKMAAGGAVVPCKGTWKLDGQPDSLEAEIPVKVNERMGVDAILGKAERKLRARIHTRITGTVYSDGDVSDEVRAAAAKNVTPVAQERITTADLVDDQAEREAAFAAEEAERAARQPGEDG